MQIKINSTKGENEEEIARGQSSASRGSRVIRARRVSRPRASRVAPSRRRARVDAQ